MMELLGLLSQGRCVNRIAAITWFISHRYGRSRRQLRLRLRPGDGGREMQFAITDIPTLVAALKTFSDGNPWSRWRPRAAPGRILDLGANVGVTALYFKWRFPEARVVAVEMMPENAAAVQRVADLNGMEIEVVNVAVTDREGEAKVRCNAQHTQHSVAVSETAVEATWGFTDRYVTVPTVSLSSLLERLKWNAVELLKVDIEGAEELLLADLERWASRAETVFMEIHHNVQPGAAEAAMVRAGFQRFGGDDVGRTELWFERR